MPTLRDVAGLAGVSVATVSNVVNNTKRVAAEQYMTTLTAQNKGDWDLSRRRTPL